jgi:NAD(P)-dependent dehydrogenase (short-subunit alcohol dehydrogenase family)
MRVLITGAASGIGRTVATILLQQHGAKTQLMLADRDEAHLLEAANELREKGATVLTRAADLADADVPAAIVREVGERFGGLDALVSNAGIIQSAPLKDLAVAEFDRIFAINTRPTWLLAKAAHALLSQSRGAVVATASISATYPTPPLGAYSASKAALLMLIEQMAVEWGPDGIRCNCVSPGPTFTALTANVYSDPRKRADRESMIPLRRIAMPEDIANTIAFLISTQGSYITGQNIMVDGGMSRMLMPATGGGSGEGKPVRPA